MKRLAVPSGNSGFTLVEALLAVLLIGIIMAALATVTAQWLPSWDRGVGRLQRIQVLSAGLDRLAGDIAAAEIVSSGRTAQPQLNAPPLFDGGELSVVFVRTLLKPGAGGGLEIVRIAETSDERGPVLVRSTAPFTPDVTGGAGAVLFSNAVTMIRAPYRVTFSYAGPDRVWHESWHQQTVLPRAVRLRLRDDATSITLAVSTTALIHAEVRASCTRPDAAAQCPELVSQGIMTANAAGGAAGTTNVAGGPAGTQ
jgi:general secretion pathway protein J